MKASKQNTSVGRAAANSDDGEKTERKKGVEKNMKRKKNRRERGGRQTNREREKGSRQTDRKQDRYRIFSLDKRLYRKVREKKERKGEREVGGDRQTDRK